LKQNKAIKSEDKKSGKEPGKGDTTESSKTAVVFSLKNEVGGLVKALRLFQVNTEHSFFCILKVAMCLVIDLFPVIKAFLGNMAKESKEPNVTKL
jgi:hypothetical protein